MNFAMTTAWVLSRVGRRIFYDLTGRNPLGSGHSPSIAEEWQAVSGLLEARADPAVQAANRTWKTPVGLVQTPEGAEAWYVQVMSKEISANVYGLRPADRFVIDCGANIGLFTLDALRNGAERVVCFEPAPETAACLRENVRQDPRVMIVEKGAWDKDETLYFSTSVAQNPGSHHVSDSGNIQIQVTTIDAVVSSLDFPRVDLIKMDIEGAETKALRGARTTIRKFHPRICVATEHTDDLHANAAAVIETVREIDPNYRYTCTESHPTWSPQLQKTVLVPYTIAFFLDGES